MQKLRKRELLGFYENELTNNLLKFWLPRCVDTENGGFYNCFNNNGSTLLARDKYTWSQGRFTWIWAKLADMQSDTFTKAERAQFLSLAKNGRDFLYQHCLIAPNDWRCVFLMDEVGNHKLVPGCDELDMSIYADCFVINAFGKYAEVAEDLESWNFCKNLFLSVLERIDEGDFKTLPYPLSPEYRAHGIPMILSNVCKEIYAAAAKFDPHFCPLLLERIDGFTQDILTHFVDENKVLHEIITAENRIFADRLGQHANPGHTIEDMWFMIDAMDLLEKPQMLSEICAITKKAFEIGWDQACGGLLHFCALNGGEPNADPGCTACEPMYAQMMNDWGGKLWWVHSETLYTSLLLYFRTTDCDFLQMHDQTATYCFEKFPNQNREIREWTQILDRCGQPVDKVVALPVKDPYHLLRNMILIIELLSKNL